jgi:hypothetical protein
MNKIKEFLTKQDSPSFAGHLTVPLWKSLLIDWGILFSLGFWYPKK